MTKPYVIVETPTVAHSRSASHPMSHPGYETAPNTFHCAVIDEQGREVPITEQMIQRACRELEDYASSIYKQSFSSH